MQQGKADINCEVLIVNNIDKDINLLLGWPFLSSHNFSIDGNNSTLSFSDFSPIIYRSLSVPKASVTVEKGDTLTKIAAKVMGQASYWKMLWRLNETALTNPNRISVGQALQYVNAKDLEVALSAGKRDPAAH